MGHLLEQLLKNVFRIPHSVDPLHLAYYCIPALFLFIFQCNHGFTELFSLLSHLNLFDLQTKTCHMLGDIGDGHCAIKFHINAAVHILQQKIVFQFLKSGHNQIHRQSSQNPGTVKSNSNRQADTGRSPQTGRRSQPSDFCLAGGDDAACPQKADAADDLSAQSGRITFFSRRFCFQRFIFSIPFPCPK